MISLTISSSMFDSKAFVNKAPKEFSTLLLPGSSVRYVCGDYGKIFIQELQLNGITILHCVSTAIKDFSIDFQWAPNMMQVHAAIEGSHHYKIGGSENLLLEEGEYNTMNTPAINGTQYLKQGKEYQSLHIIYSVNFLEQLLPLFPNLNKSVASSGSKPRFLFRQNLLLSTEQRNILRSLFNCTAAGHFSTYYVEIMVMQFLLLCTIPADRRINAATGLTKQHMQLIHESRRLLDTKYSQSWAVNEIARELGISELRLRDGFKKVFGISMKGYMIQTKMELAQKLLSETNKPIKEIAGLAGYSTKQSFFNAFRKYFHQTPGSIR